MSLSSYAKINLTLKINYKNKNNLHEIQSYFCLIDLADKIKINKINNTKTIPATRIGKWYASDSELESITCNGNDTSELIVLHDQILIRSYSDDYSLIDSNSESTYYNFIDNKQETTLEFPVRKYPVKLKTLNLVKTPAYTGTLKGVKGQYLIFDDDTVFNVRSNEGFVVSINML